jgi:hypothetical protein
MVYNQEIAEILVAGGVAIGVIGVFWRVILAGIIGFCCLFVMLNHSLPDLTQKDKPTPVVIQRDWSSINPIQNAEPVKPVDPKRDEYIKECTRYGIEKQKCESIWDGTEEENI